MILNNSYKKAMDKITLSEEMKKSIIKNASEAANIKKKVFNLIYLQKAAGLAACLIICLLSYHVATDHVYVPSDIVKSTVNTPVPEHHNTDNAVQNTETNQPIQGDVPATVKSDNINGSEIQSHTQTNRNNVDSYQSQTIPANNVGVAPVDGNACENSTVIVSDHPDADTSPLVVAENPSVGDVIFPDTENTGSDIQQSSGDKTSFDGNPMQNITNTARIENELGYSIKTPDYIPKNYQLSDMCVIADDLAQIIYESENDIICYRTAKGDDDISGDYNTYTNIETININNYDVTIKGNDNLYHNASWTDGSESFSVCSDSGIEKEIMVDIVESVE